MEPQPPKSKLFLPISKLNGKALYPQEHHDEVDSSDGHRQDSFKLLTLLYPLQLLHPRQSMLDPQLRLRVAELFRPAFRSQLAFAAVKTARENNEHTRKAIGGFLVQRARALCAAKEIDAQTGFVDGRGLAQRRIGPGLELEVGFPG